jgi:LacI family transcriptional regulator
LKSATDDRDIAAAVGYINQHACEGLSVERIVKETQQVTKPVFVRRFRAATGQTPRAAILDRQLDEARRLLAGTELSLAFIAEHSGFRKLAALERAFQAAEGKTATAFRQRSQPVGQNQSASSFSRPQPRKVRPAGAHLSKTA